MRNVERAPERSLDQFGNAPVCTSRFELLKKLWVSEAAQVSEDGCAGIEIRVRTPGH